MYELKGLTDEQMMPVRMEAQLRLASQHNSMLETAERNAGLRRESEAEGRKVMEKILAENAVKAKAEAEQLRRTSAANLEAELRREYFGVNGDALESDFQRDLSEMKQRHFIEKMTTRKSEEASRAGVNYGRM
jgi:hypothetical protein